MKHFVFWVLLLVTLSCNNKDKEIRIDLDKDFDSSVEIALSDIVSNLEYIPLETDTNCLLEENTGILLFDNEIVAVNKRKILLFDRKNGKFKREILHRGKDPEGYNSTMLGKGLMGNEKEEYVFLREWNGDISTYSLKSGERKSFPYGNYGAVAYADNGTFFATLLNMDGKNKVKMWVYKDYQLVDSIPNKQLFELKSNAIAFFDNEDIFYRYNGETYYKYNMNDTVFCVSVKGLAPAYTFNSTNKLRCFEMRDHPELIGEQMKELYVVSGIMESKDYIMYNISYDDEKYKMVYDKKTGRGGCLEDGFSNDIDNGISLWPNHTTEKGEFVFLVNPASLEEAELKALGLKEDDNPMLVVGK